MQTNETDNNYYSLNEAADCLHVSTATVRNWIKTNKIKADAYNGKQPCFLRSKIIQLKSDIISGKNTSLKSRRNKEYSIGNSLYCSYVSPTSPNIKFMSELFDSLNGISLTKNYINAILLQCAIKLYPFGHTKTYNDNYSDETFIKLCNDLCSDTQIDNFHFNKSIFDDIHFDKDEDTLGLIYSSLSQLKSRKKSGSYFTPMHLAKTLNETILSYQKCNTPFNKTILDPACGSGSFLLTLPDNIPFEYIFGNDIDYTSICIARINFYLRNNDLTYEQLCSHFTCNDFLADNNNSVNREKFDYIIGNPPWGSRIDSVYLDALKSSLLSASKKGIDSFDLFIEKSIYELNDEGTIGFIVPKSLLNVKAHELTREILLSHGYFTNIINLEDSFDGVICPGIFLVWSKQRHDTITINDNNEKYKIKTEARAFTKDFLPFFISNNDYIKLDKLSNVPDSLYLKNNASFGLGIVTGNNRDLLIPADTYQNSYNNTDSEINNIYPILKGTNINRYQITPAQFMIHFDKNTLQQSAALSLYQAPAKLVYRFINKRLTFALDETKSLTLNSANFLIPHIAGLSEKYILAVLNSSTAQFIFENRFSSIKVLRSHLEQIPIPAADEKKQQEIIHYVDLISCCNSQSEYEYYDNIINQLIEELYQI